MRIEAQQGPAPEPVQQGSISRVQLMAEALEPDPDVFNTEFERYLWGVLNLSLRVLLFR